MNQRIPATIVNHAVVDVAVSVDIVWREILAELVEAKDTSGMATVTHFTDATAPLGGFSVQFDAGDGVTGERIVYFTERDDAARRMSICTDLRSGPNSGRKAYGTYQAVETAEGASLKLDSHTVIEVDLPSDGDVAAVIATQKAAWDEMLTAGLQVMKERLEASQ